MAAAATDLKAAFDEAARLQAAGRFAESAQVLQAILASFPQSAEAHANLGLALTRLERLEAAEAAYRRAVELRPDADWALRGLGSLLHYTGRWREAQALYERALELAPDDPRLKLNLGYIRLGLGDFAGGWPLIEHRTELADQNAARPPRPNEWRGEPLAGKRLLIWPEQGFGDQIQFARFAPVLRDAGAYVTLACPPELLVLFATLGVRVVDHRAVGAEAFDHWTLPLSIPGRLGVTVDTLRTAPYLSAPEHRRRRWAGEAGLGAVGVCWRGRKSHPNDAHRSLPSPALLERLRGTGAALVDLGEPRGDFADTAAILEQLDLVISVDTAVAHLAGAMGKPCWLLLPAFRQDWRWMQGRTDSPWYPSLRLFRQPKIGDWATVLEDVARALEAGR